MSNKTTIIQQGTGDDALEMTVQVTQEELDKMEEIRSKDPSAWEGRGLDLVKAAKDAVIEASEENAQPKKCTNWKLILGITIGVLAIIGTIIFSGKSKDKEPEVSQQNPNEYIHNLWLLSSQNGYKRDEKYLKEELIKSVEYRKLFYDKLKAEEPNFVENYSDFEKHWLYDVLSEPIYGLNLGTPKEFDSLVTNNEESRRWLWEKANECGLDVGKDFDEFWLLIAPESYYGKLYLDAKARGIKWDEKQFHELLSGDNIAWLYNILKQENLLIEGSEADFRAWLEIKSNRVYLYNELKNRNSISHNSIKEFDEWLGYTSIPEKTDNDLKKYTSLTYNFTIQYDDKEFQLVEKQNKNSHCVMKLQSPNDEVKSILVSVWENPEFSSSYDTDFISSCQSVDEAMGKVISSTVKTKVDGVNALKSELIISPMGKSYYAAIYRIIHKKRMYMLNIYIPIEEYNKDKSYGDKCANNFKFN